MLSIMRGSVNGKEGFICQLTLPNKAPQTIATDNRLEIASLLDMLE